MTDTDPFAGSSGVTNILLIVLVGLVGVCLVTFVYFHVFRNSNQGLNSELDKPIQLPKSVKPDSKLELFAEEEPLSHLDDPVLTHIHMNAHGMQQPALAAFLL